mgnify:CR=1 FL=1
MNVNDKKTIVYSRNTVEFVTVAAELCLFGTIGREEVPGFHGYRIKTLAFTLFEGCLVGGY